MKKLSTIRASILTVLLIIPSLVFASDLASRGFGTLGTLVNAFTNTVVKALGSLFLASAVVAFFYGMVQYIWGRQQGNGDKTKVGNQFMVWGLIALFVMFSVWGIIYYVQTIFGIQDRTRIVIPEIILERSGSAPATPNPFASPLDPTITPSGDPIGGGRMGM
jgi:hypothetical protein